MKSTLTKAQWLIVLYDENSANGLQVMDDGEHVCDWEGEYVDDDAEAEAGEVIKTKDGQDDIWLHKIPEWTKEYALIADPSTDYEDGESYGLRSFVVKHTPANKLYEVAYDYDSWDGIGFRKADMYEVVAKKVEMIVYEPVTR